MATTLLHSILDKLKGTTNQKKCATEQGCHCRQFIEKNRLIIFKHHDARGRCVMYDSVSPSKDASGKCCRKKPTDSKLIGEMMFGSAPLPQKVSTLKVHLIPNPPQLMVTKVFVPVPCTAESSSEHESFDLYSIQHEDSSIGPVAVYNTNTTNVNLINSLPVSVPAQFSSSYCEDSGFSASGSSSLSSHGPSPCGSLTALASSRSRRLERFQKTSLEYGVENSFQCEQLEFIPGKKRPVKIGVGIIFMLEEDLVETERFLDFFFSHIMLIESYVHKLKQSIDKAIAVKKRCVIDDALNKFFSSVYCLYSAPRIVEPVWLSMMTSSPQRASLCSRFFNDLMSFIEQFDTKSTNFFFSCLLTGILTHHLSWTQTVAPVGSEPSKTYLDKSTASWVNSLSRSHPYNPLWAQLGDLYGAIGFPRRLSRTVVVGKNEQMVRKLLQVLTYFIRCSEILENKECFPMLDSPVSSPSESTRTICGCGDCSCCDVRDIISVSCSAGSRNEVSPETSQARQNTGDKKICVSVHPSTERSSEQLDKAVQENEHENTRTLPDTRPLVLLRTDIPDSDWKAIQSSESDANTGQPAQLVKSVSNLDCVVNLESCSNESTPMPCRLHEKNPEDFVRSVISVKATTVGNAAVGTSSAPSRPKSLKLKTGGGGKTQLHSGVFDNQEIDNSIFDEYFDDPIVTVGPEPYSSSFDDVIFTEPCPDVSHIVTPPNRLKLSLAGSSSCEPVCTSAAASIAPTTSSSELMSADNIDNDGVTFVNGHFALCGEHLTDVPDGPSKRMICSTIELMYDRVSLKSDEFIDQADYMRQWANEPAVRPVRPMNHRCSVSHSNNGSVSCRPTSPCDCTRQHRSSSTSSEITYMEQCDRVVQVPMPACSDSLDEACAVPTNDYNFGRSLMADYCESYQSDFVLQGTSDRSFLNEDLHQDLQMALKTSVLDEPIDEASCIVADIDNCSVQLFSCKYKLPEVLKTQELIPSQLVGRTLETLLEFHKLNVTPEFCLMHLEDQLQSIYIKSQLVAEYINVHQRLYHQQLMALHGFDLSDMPLLLAVASTHSPHLLLSLMDMTVCRG